MRINIINYHRMGFREHDIVCYYFRSIVIKTPRTGFTPRASSHQGSASRAAPMVLKRPETSDLSWVESTHQLGGSFGPTPLVADPSVGLGLRSWAQVSFKTIVRRIPSFQGGTGRRSGKAWVRWRCRTPPHHGHVATVA